MTSTTTDNKTKRKVIYHQKDKFLKREDPHQN